jgi:hypothetical protein
VNERSRELLEQHCRQILGFTTVGGVRWPNLVLAQRHAREWQSVSRPGVAPGPVQICEDCARDRLRPGACEHCGSETVPLSLSASSMVERAERDEDRRTGVQAAQDERLLAEQIPAFQAELVLAKYTGCPTPELAKVAQELARVVARCVLPYRLPPEAPPAGCRSCDRLNRRKGRKASKTVVWEALSPQERYAKQGLCSWCGKHTVGGVLPPIEAVEVRHRQGEHMAGRWLAKQEARKKAS